MAELRVTSTGTIKLFESDDTSSVTIASPASLGGDRTITLPDANVDLTEVNTMPIANLDIDGGTDIGAAIVDADLFIIDDGAGGTNRKTTASRIKTYIGSPSFAGLDDQSSSNDDQLTITDTAVVINEDSDDVDFRVEGNGDPNLMIVDGGVDNVSFSRGSDATDQAIVHISRGGYNPGSNGKHALMVGADIGDANTLTNNTRKLGSIVGPHYTNAEEPITIARLDSESGSSELMFGGTSETNSVEKIIFRTASDDADKSTGAERMRISANGNVTIGTTGDHQKLYVYGSHYSDNGLVKIQTSNGSGANDIMFFEDGNNHDCGEIYLDASANTVAYNTSSDYRLKENEVAISDGIDRVKKLKPYRFNWISKPDQTVDGFFAHEVQGIVDEAITGEKDAMKTANNVVVNADGTVEKHDVTKEDWEQGKIDGVYASNTTWEATKQVIKRQSIDQSKLVPLLTAALQEAITEIESLKARVTTLEG